jgi:threonylcarbamoyladenosine tRNA methylthiotransferase MtaB
MMQLAQRSERKFCQRFLGKNLNVLWEHEVTPGSSIYSGLSDNYIRIFTLSSETLINKFRQVLPARLHNQGLWGEITDEN